MKSSVRLLCQQFNRLPSVPMQAAIVKSMIITLENWPIVFPDISYAGVVPYDKSRGFLIAEPIAGKPAYLRIKAIAGTTFKRPHRRSRYPVEVEEFLETATVDGWQYGNSDKFVVGNYRGGQHGEERHGPSIQYDGESMCEMKLRYCLVHLIWNIPRWRL